MKKILLTVLIIAGMLVTLSCGMFKKDRLDSVKNVALITVFCDKSIDMSDFSGLASAVSSLAQSEDFNLDPIAVKLRDKVLDEYASSFPFSFVAEDDVINNDAYQAISTPTTAFVATPKGYKYFSPLMKDDYLKAFDAIADADAVMMAYVSYKLAKQGEVLGFGTAKVQATVMISIKNKEGKTVISKSVFSQSDESIKFALGGVFDAKEIRPLCEKATDDALTKLDEWIQDKIAKQ